MQSTYIVNAPLLFAGIWNIVKHMVDKEVQKKTHIYSNFPKHLFEHTLMKDKTPTFLKGTCVEELWTEPGPWEEELALAEKENRLYLENDFLFEKYFASQRELRGRLKWQNSKKEPVTKNSTLESIMTQITIQEHRIKRPKSAMICKSMSFL